MNLRALPIKEAMGLIDKHLEEKEKQCESHNATTKELTSRIEKNERQLIILKYGIITMILNILLTAGSIFVQLIKKG